MPQFSYLPLVNEKGVFYGPAQVVLEDKTSVEDSLREQTTTSWKKGWSEQTYDFPNTYVTLPLRVIDWNPINTFGEYQNDRFAQRYYTKDLRRGTGNSSPRPLGLVFPRTKKIVNKHKKRWTLS